MGPSGSGKSTLLGILGCLDRPTAGEYRLDGEEVASLDDDRLSRIRNLRIGFVFQSFHLIPELTVVENVETPLLYGPVPLAELAARAPSPAWTGWASAIGRTIGPPSCRAARPSARRWPAPS